MIPYLSLFKDFLFKIARTFHGIFYVCIRIVRSIFLVTLDGLIKIFSCFSEVPCENKFNSGFSEEKIGKFGMQLIKEVFEYILSFNKIFVSFGGILLIKINGSNIEIKITKYRRIFLWDLGFKNLECFLEALSGFLKISHQFINDTEIVIGFSYGRMI